MQKELSNWIDVSKIRLDATLIEKVRNFKVEDYVTKTKGRKSS